MASDRKCTEPSAKTTLTPPDCRLVRARRSPQSLALAMGNVLHQGLLRPGPGRASKLAEVTLERAAQMAAMFLEKSRSPTRRVLLVPSVMPVRRRAAGLLTES